MPDQPTADTTRALIAEADLGAIERRVIAAVHDTDISRSSVEYDWPECHKSGCQGSHPAPSSALTTMLIQISRRVKDELRHRTTTRPDVAEDGDSPEVAATMTLAVLLSRYTSGTTGGANTWMDAARLMVEAYPGMIAALNEGEDR